MRPFHFRLDTLLKHRKMQEEQAQVSFGAAVTHYQQMLALLRQLESERSLSMERLCQKQHQGLMIEEFKLFQNYFDKLTVEIDHQSQSVFQADQQRQECLKALQDAAKQHKLVQKLREKKLTQYEADRLQEEQKTLDETGLQLFTRGKSGDN